MQELATDVIWQDRLERIDSEVDDIRFIDTVTDVDQDESGFSRLIRRLNRDGYIQTLCYRRYQHRISITGEPLFYVAVIARKLKDLDCDLLESLQGE